MHPALAVSCRHGGSGAVKDFAGRFAADASRSLYVIENVFLVQVTYAGKLTSERHNG